MKKSSHNWWRLERRCWDGKENWNFSWKLIFLYFSRIFEPINIHFFTKILIFHKQKHSVPNLVIITWLFRHLVISNKITMYSQSRKQNNTIQHIFHVKSYSANFIKNKYSLISLLNINNNTAKKWNRERRHENKQKRQKV